MFHYLLVTLPIFANAVFGDNLDPYHVPVYHPEPYQPPVHAPIPHHAPPAPHYQHYDETPKAYAFKYDVNDEYRGTRYNVEESTDGKLTTGSYQVALPDGRIQTVTYTVDGYSGFIADVHYDGVAIPPKHEPHPVYTPPPPPHYHPVHKQGPIGPPPPPPHLFTPGSLAPTAVGPGPFASRAAGPAPLPLTPLPGLDSTPIFRSGPSIDPTRGFGGAPNFGF
nr:cuticle protein 19.8-like [Lepeophtheirus salmonis]